MTLKIFGYNVQSPCLKAQHRKGKVRKVRPFYDAYEIHDTVNDVPEEHEMRYPQTFKTRSAARNFIKELKGKAKPSNKTLGDILAAATVAA